MPTERFPITGEFLLADDIFFFIRKVRKYEVKLHNVVKHVRLYTSVHPQFGQRKRHVCIKVYIFRIFMPFGFELL